MGQYATKEQLKEYLKASQLAQGGTINALLDTILIRCSRAIDTLCDRGDDGFLSAAATVLFDGRNTKKLFPQRPIQSLTAIDVKLGGTIDTTWTSVPLTDLFLEPADRRTGAPALWIELADFPTGAVFVFPKGKRTVRVNATWDYPAIPTVVEEVTLELAVRVFQARGAGFSDIVGVASDEVDQIIVTKAIPALGKEILKKLTREPVFA